jgi:tripartite-type tricarboxylate transporter receptor subunit TctC
LGSSGTTRENKWAGLFAPKGTPSEIVSTINSAFNDVLRDSQIRQRLVDTGTEVTPMSTERFASFVHSESEKYVNLIKETGVKAR